MKLLFTSLVIFLAFVCNAQVMNIEQQRIVTDTTGWAGTSQISSSFTKNTDQLLTIGFKDHLQYKTDSSLYLMLIDYNLVKSPSSDFDNAGTLHFRYNYKLLNHLTFEAFTQGQFNKLLNVNFRWLLGAGPRFKVIGHKNFRVYFASLYMYEYEELETPLLFHRNHRLSSYISITWKNKTGTILTNTVYYQPRFDRISDFRIYNQFDLSLRISKKLSFTTSYKYFFDSNPAENIINATHNLSNGITFRF